MIFGRVGLIKVWRRKGLRIRGKQAAAIPAEEKDSGHRFPNASQGLYTRKDRFHPRAVILLHKSLLHGNGRAEVHGIAENERLKNRLAQVRHRLDQAFIDKLDGKITDAFLESKSAEWNQDQETILVAMRALERQNPDNVLNRMKILELANKACFLYLRQEPSEQAKLLRIVLSNCKVDALSVYPVYNKPFPDGHCKLFAMKGRHPKPCARSGICT